MYILYLYFCLNAKESVGVVNVADNMSPLYLKYRISQVSVKKKATTSVNQTDPHVDVTKILS